MQAVREVSPDLKNSCHWTVLCCASVDRENKSDFFSLKWYNIICNYWRSEMVVNDRFEKFKCTQCGSMELCFGYLGTAANVFVPSGFWTLHGFRTRSFVCLKCGHMGHYIPKHKLLKMREKIKDAYSEE